jgi:hypothetical protein
MLEGRDTLGLNVEYLHQKVRRVVLVKVGVFA